MKKIFVFTLFILGFILLTTSCQKEPLARFNYPTSVNAGEQIDFYNLSTDAHSYLWNFGDGKTSTEKNPKHIYTTSGRKAVTLTAFSKNEKKNGSITGYINVINTTRLKLTVYHKGTTNPVKDCEITLFGSQNDWDNYKNELGYGFTDARGEIIFTNAQPKVYYIDAYKESGLITYTNWDLAYITPKLTENITNSFIVYVEPQIIWKAETSKTVYKIHSVEKNMNNRLLK